jgi:molybdopterin-synthase adenylyltransferase
LGADVKIVLVGVGALGSHALQFARNVDAAWTLIDMDRVEQKNTSSQFHSRMGLGRNKAQALQQAMQGLFGLKLQAVPHRLTDDNVEQLLGGADLVVECVDNGATRRSIQAFVRARGLPCLHGALSADGMFGRVIWDEHFVIDDEDVVGQATCDGGQHLPFIALAGAALAQAIQDFVAHGQRTNLYVRPGAIQRI